MSTIYGYSNFIGTFHSDGGEATGGENGAAGTVFTKDTAVNGKKTLKIYNREGEGVTCVIHLFVFSNFAENLP